MGSNTFHVFSVGRLVRGVAVYGNGLVFLLASILFIFSFFNVRMLTVGWYSTCGGITGQASILVELGQGGILICGSDLGCRTSDGLRADGLNLLHAKLEPIFGIDRDFDRPTYPKLYSNRHWINSLHDMAGFGWAIANDSSQSKYKSTYTNTFRGVEFALPLPFAILPSLYIALASYKRRRAIKKSLARFPIILSP